MKSRVQKSLELFEEAKALTPGGAQTSRRPKLFGTDYPILMERGNGCHVYDVDGNEYIDWMASYGPIILGHCYRRVDEAVIKEMKNGFLHNLTSPLQLELMRKLIELIPCAEMVVFVATGSEATQAAVRIARVKTGRNKIVRWGYHGWFDWAVGGVGVPQYVAKDTLSFYYNDLDSLERVLKENKSEVAGIIMMPLSVELPEPGFLEGVREMADAHGVILIFDEIRSWPRMSLGGAQEYFGVTPDIATIGKAIANGHTLSAVVGKREILEAVEKTNVSGSFFMNNLAARAALTTLQELEEKNGVDYLWNVGRKLMGGLREQIAASKVRAEVIGVPPMPFLIFGDKQDHTKVWQEMIFWKGDPGSEKDRRAIELFYGETVRGGVFFHPRHHWYSCLSHTDEDVKKTLQVTEKAFDVARKTVV